MKVFLFILAVLAALAGAGTLVSAKSAIHEIEAFILFLVGAVCLSGAAIVEAVSSLRVEVESRAATLVESVNLVEAEITQQGKATVGRLNKLGGVILAVLQGKKPPVAKVQNRPTEQGGALSDSGQTGTD